MGVCGRERERESFLIYEGNRTACMRFYIQPSPIHGTILDLIMHVHIFKATTHRYTHGVNEV